MPLGDGPLAILTAAEVDLDQMIADATAARNGAPVLALSRKDQHSVDQLCAWVRWMNQERRIGRHTATDPGPMAPHFHAHGDADELFHTHRGENV
jgi:urease accessory protein